MPIHTLQFCIPHHVPLNRGVIEISGPQVSEAEVDENHLEPHDDIIAMKVKPRVIEMKQTFIQ